MKLMKPTTLFLAVISSLAALSTCAAGTFKGPWGLQLYSLRTELATNVPGTLDEVKSWGVKNVELAGTYNLTPEQFKAQLDLHASPPSVDIFRTTNTARILTVSFTMRRSWD